MNDIWCYVLPRIGMVCKGNAQTLHQQARELYVKTLWRAVLVHKFQWGIVGIDTEDKRILPVKAQMGSQW